jgi:DNA modification methylase
LRRHVEYCPQFEVIFNGTKGNRRARIWTGGRSEADVWDFDADRPVVAREVPEGSMALEFGAGHDTVQVLLDRKASGTVVEFDGATSDVWLFGRPRGEYVHPTQKPVALVARALTNSSREGDNSTDPRPP